MDSLPLEILFIVVLSILNGLLAMAELAVVSANRMRLSTMAESGNPRAKVALELSENSTEFLATVQIGITLVGIVAGVFGGAAIAEDFSHGLVRIGIQPHFAEPVAYTLVIGTITYLSVIFGELVPKQIALAYPEQVALIVARPMALLSRLCLPVVWLLETSSTLVTRLLPFKTGKQTEVSEDDIRILISQGTETGEIQPAEKEMAFRMFRMADRPIRAFMTVRRDVVWLDLAKSFEANWQVALEVAHSFFPVAEETLDNLIGIVSVKDLFLIKSSNGEKKLEDFIKPALKVPSKQDALSVLEVFKRERRQMAVVIDPHGGVSGVITTHDLLEALVGDLADYEGEERSIVNRDDGSCLVDGAVDIQEVLFHLGRDTLDHEQSKEFHSIGGIVFREMNSVPQVGGKITWKGLVIEVVDMDGYRIDKVLVSVVPEPTELSEGGSGDQADSESAS